MKKKRPGDPEKDMRTREAKVGDRETSATDRESTATDRENTATDRESSAKRRESTATIRESTATDREDALVGREEIARLREKALTADEALRDAQDARSVLSAQMREANEKLVLAMLRADELADETNATRLAITESEERFRTLVVTSSAVIWHATPEGTIRLDAQSWKAFTGLSAAAQGDDGGWGWLEAVHAEDRAPLRKAWTEAVGSRGKFVHQHRLRRPDGSWSWVMSRAVSIPEEGDVREWLGMMADITDRVRVEEARERFIGILGHDLRSPLGAILAGTELLKGADLPEKAAMVATRITRSAHRIDAIIRDMLDFARGRLAGGIPIVRTPCDLGEIAARSVEEMKSAHPGRAIQLEGRGDLSGDWDADRLEQVLSNLIGNAIRHGVDPIRVETSDAGPAVTLAVHNRGTPIPPASLDRLFEPFARGNDGTEGLGLGLYIVSEIVRSHGATITVRSSEAEGTTFSSTWPRRAPGLAK